MSDGYREVIVSVLRDNLRALRFYERGGFVLVPDSATPIEIGGAELTHVVMRCPL